MAIQSNSVNSKQGTTPQKRSKAKIVLWIIGSIFIVVVLLLMLLPTLLSTSLGKKIITGQINQSLDGTMEIKNLSVSWFSGLKLTGVSFKDKAGTVTFDVDEIRGRPSLLSLLGGRIHLTDGVIDKPRVELTVLEQPESAVDETRAEKSSRPPSDEPVVLPLDKLSLELRDGNAVIKTRQPPARLEFKNISTQVNINPAGQTSKLALALAIAGTGQEGTVKADADITPGKAMTLEGTSGQVQMEMVNVNLEDFKPLLALAGQKIDIAGLVNAQAEVKLTDGQFEKIRADATVENFTQTLDGKTTALNKPVKIQALAAMTDKGFRLDNLNVESSFCNATCKGDLSSLAYQVEANLAGVQSVASQFSDFSGYSLAGQLNASGSVSMKDQVISSVGIADVANLTATKGDVKMPATALNVKYDITHDSAAKLLRAPSVSVVMDAGTINLENVSVPLESEKITQLSTVADVSLDLQKTLTLAKVFAADKLPKDFNLAGALRSQLTVLPKGQEMQFRTDKTEIQNFVLEQAGQAPLSQRSMTLIADGSVNPTAKLLKAPSVSVVMDAGTINLKNVSVPLESENIAQLSTIADVSLDLQKALTMVKIFAADKLPKDFSLAGALRSQLTVLPKGQDIQFRTDKTEIQNLVVGQAGKTPFTQDILTLAADGSVNPKTQNYAANFNLEGKKGQSLMRFKGNVAQKAQKEQTAMSGDVQAEYDWKDLTAMAKPFLPEGFSMEGKRNDKITFSSIYPTAQPDKMTANLNANAALGFQRANFMGLKFGPTELKLDVKQGKAAIDLSDADVNQGKVRFAGDIDLAAKPMKLTLRKPTQVVENVRIDDVISSQLLQYLNPVFSKGTNVSGLANLNCQTLIIPLSGGTPKDILLNGAIGLTDVKLQSPLLQLIGQVTGGGLNLFSVPPTLFTVKDGLVEYADMPMFFGQNYALHFLRGKIGLVDKSLSMDVQIPLKERTHIVPLGGTLDKPALDTSKLIIGNITEQIPIKDEKTKEAVEKGLEILDGILKKGTNK